MRRPCWRLSEPRRPDARPPENVGRWPDQITEESPPATASRSCRVRSAALCCGGQRDSEPVNSCAASRYGTSPILLFGAVDLLRITARRMAKKRLPQPGGATAKVMETPGVVGNRRTPQGGILHAGFGPRAGGLFLSLTRRWRRISLRNLPGFS